MFYFITLTLWAGIATVPDLQVHSPRTSSWRAESVGYWEAPVNHDFMPMPHFNSLHSALIPEGPQRGKVLTWNNLHGTGGSLAYQAWAVVDFSTPGAPVFQNESLAMPTNEGDLFCAGFAWTPDGKLFVAGGTSQYSDTLTGLPWLGGRLAYLYDPSDFSATPLGTWNRLPDMQETRWYPTVVLMPDDTLLSLGGTNNTDQPDLNNYEAFALDPMNPVSGSWQTSGPGARLFAGPVPGPLGKYPRVHPLPSGELFLSGMTGYSALLDHANAPGIWVNTPRSGFEHREYGSSVLFPLLPGQPASVGILGGIGFNNGFSYGLQGDLEICQPLSAGVWANGPSFGLGRIHPSATLLPDGAIFLSGGQAEEPLTRIPMLLENGAWRPVATMASLREYHSTAILLPDGRVLTSGGNVRSWDYQVWVPPCLCRGNPRPAISGMPTLAGYRIDNAPNLVVDHASMSNGSVARAVLVRPGAVTHAFNVDQRVVELETAAQGGASIEVRPPQDSAEAPRGWYMLFLISDQGTPSEAGWVQFK